MGQSLWLYEPLGQLMHRCSSILIMHAEKGITLPSYRNDPKSPLYTWLQCIPSGQFNRGYYRVLFHTRDVFLYTMLNFTRFPKLQLNSYLIEPTLIFTWLPLLCLISLGIRYETSELQNCVIEVFEQGIYVLSTRRNFFYCKKLDLRNHSFTFKSEMKNKYFQVFK